MLAQFADCCRQFWDNLSLTVCQIVSRIGHFEHVGPFSGRGTNWCKLWSMCDFSVSPLDTSCLWISQLDPTTYYPPQM